MPTKENVPLARTRCVPFFLLSVTSTYQDRTETDDLKAEPAAKRRKLAPAGSQPMQSSFADVLERLKEETGESVGEFLAFPIT
jgi:hypothetical protein